MWSFILARPAEVASFHFGSDLKTVCFVQIGGMPPAADVSAEVGDIAECNAVWRPMPSNIARSEHSFYMPAETLLSSR
jgi:hypothetical protein